MKYLKYIATVFVVGTLVLFASCGDDGGGDGPDPEVKFAHDIIQGGTWSLASVNRDGTDVSSDFSGFTISFTSTGYTTSNGDTFGVWAKPLAKATRTRR